MSETTNVQLATPPSKPVVPTVTELVNLLHEEFITPDVRAQIEVLADSAFEEIFGIVRNTLDEEIRGCPIHSHIVFRIPRWNLMKVVTSDTADEKTLSTHKSVPSGVLCSRLFSEALRKRLVDFGFSKKDDGELICTVELRHLLKI